MIYTVTFNPSLDYVVYVDPFEQGMVNRTQKEMIFIGGKGINVSIILKNLGIDSRLLGFTAGFTGNQVEHTLQNLGCTTDFISLSEGLTRINVKIKSRSETEINGQGPKINPQDFQCFLQKLEQLQAGDYLVLAGSIPSCLSDDTYEMILKKLQHKNIQFVVDATANLLLNVLKYRPFLVKPNHHELAEMFGVQIETEDALIDYGQKLREMGARNVVISRAEAGAILLAEDGTIEKLEAPIGTVVNSTGAGDSMVAGFLAGYMQTKDLKEAFKKGVAAGSATAFSEGLAERNVIDQIYQKIL